jgi:death on curing protein
VSFEFVRVDVLRNVQGRLIERYGGLPGVRDDGALESAIARPRNLYDYEVVTSAAGLGAALAWAILRNHPFIDGNKRAAFAGLTMFLELNGYQWTCSEVEETGMVLRATASEISEEEWMEWVGRSVARAGSRG